ncbi:MAG: hypothetical protein RML94_15150, partial [Bacteroidia bacterium]|nr:hypothetical protein [Bacteroidia bacterium]
PARAPARDTPKKVKLFFRLDIKYQSKSIYSRFNLVHTSKSIQNKIKVVYENKIKDLNLVSI